MGRRLSLLPFEPLSGELLLGILQHPLGMLGVNLVVVGFALLMGTDEVLAVLVSFSD